MRLGFSACGMAQACAVESSHADFFTHWVERGCHADMNYLERHADKRFHPSLLVEGTRTIVSVALNYYPSVFLPDGQPQISWYAYGQDYHDVMRVKLQQLFDAICAVHPDISVSGRCFCDTAPLLERYWAWQAGLGWLGRNKQLVIPHAGSTFFLGEILLNMDADHYDSPMDSKCGTCSRCIDACPVQALSSDGGLDARRCLSYLTIEHRGDIPHDAVTKMSTCFYGCDRCQQVCPHLCHATPTKEQAFMPRQELLEMGWEEWQQLTEEKYRSLFKGSAVKRAKFSGLCRNIKAMLKTQQGEPSDFT